MTAPSVDLSALDALAEAATAGKWEIDGFHTSSLIIENPPHSGRFDRILDTGSGPRWKEDARFVRELVNAWPTLKAEIEALRGENEVLREEGMTTEAMCAIAAAFAYEHAARAIEAQATTCADIALEGGDRARANESMEAALTVAARMVRALKSKPTPAVPEEALNMVIDAHVARLRAALGATS